MSSAFWLYNLTLIINLKIAMASKLMRVPAWWDENQKEIDKTKQEITHLLGVSSDWLIKNQGKGIATLMAQKNFPDDINRKIEWMFRHIANLSEYNFSKFRLE